MTLLIQKFDNFVVPLNHCYCYASDQGSNAKHKLSNNKYSYYCLKRIMARISKHAIIFLKVHMDRDFIS